MKSNRISTTLATRQKDTSAYKILTTHIHCNLIERVEQNKICTDQNHDART